MKRGPVWSYSRSARLVSGDLSRMKLCLRRSRGGSRLLISLFAALTCASAFAHDPGLSSANLEIGDRVSTLQLTFNARDIAALQEKLDLVAQRAVAIRIGDRSQPMTSVASSVDSNNNVEFRYTLVLPQEASEITFESLLLKELSFGHRQAFAVTDSRGTEIARRILSGREPMVTIPRSVPPPGDASRESRFFEFFTLGIRHILTGYDHLLFLFGLLIVCRTPRTALLLITCFTLAHSLTLALSTFGLVDLPSRLVEATIAASILYVGIENLFHRNGPPRGRWLLTFAFGLIHGLGFASVLHEMGIAKTGLSAIVPLVAFNSGVEAGQLAVAAIVLPLIWQVRKRPAFVRLGVPAASVLVAVAGGYWLLERTLFS